MNETKLQLKKKINIYDVEQDYLPENYDVIKDDVDDEYLIYLQVMEKYLTNSQRRFFLAYIELNQTYRQLSNITGYTHTQCRHIIQTIKQKIIKFHGVHSKHLNRTY